MQPHGCNYSLCPQIQRSSGWLTVLRRIGGLFKHIRLIVVVRIADGPSVPGLLRKLWTLGTERCLFTNAAFPFPLPSILAIQEAKPQQFIHFTQTEKTSGWVISGQEPGYGGSMRPRAGGREAGRRAEEGLDRWADRRTISGGIDGDFCWAQIRGCSPVQAAQPDPCWQELLFPMLMSSVLFEVTLQKNRGKKKKRKQQKMWFMKQRDSIWFICFRKCCLLKSYIPHMATEHPLMWCDKCPLHNEIVCVLAGNIDRAPFMPFVYLSIVVMAQQTISIWYIGKEWRHPSVCRVLI